MSSDSAHSIKADTAQYCFLDIDLDNHRSRLATTAAFIHATDTRYGFSSNDLRRLGGSEVTRIPDFMPVDHEWGDKLVKGTIYEEVALRPPVAGQRIIVKLYWDVAPMACQNFATLCANGGAAANQKQAAPIGHCGKPLQYRGSSCHRVIPGFIVQGGDFVFGNGSGGESIFGGSNKKFKDERAGLNLKHDRRGILSMGNSGKNSNSSQFFLTFAAAPQCDGKHVVFGHVVSGWPVLSAIERVGRSGGGEPKCPITITDCGIWKPLGEIPAAGYWYDKPDPDSFSGMSSLFMVRPRVAVLVPTEEVGKKFESVLKPTCVLVATVAMGNNALSSLEAAGRAFVELLETFAVDVIVVTPACSKPELIELLPLPASWSSEKLTQDQVVLLNVPPVEALTAVRTKSWLAQRKGPCWHLDGVID